MDTKRSYLPMKICQDHDDDSSLHRIPDVPAVSSQGAKPCKEAYGAWLPPESLDHALPDDILASNTFCDLLYQSKL